MITLDRLVNVLGGYGVRLRWSSVPRSIELRSVVIHEAATKRTVIGDVLLAIGAGSLREAVRWATSARAVVLVMREGEQPITFDSDAEVGAVMVVARPPGRAGAVRGEQLTDGATFTMESAVRTARSMLYAIM